MTPFRPSRPSHPSRLFDLPPKRLPQHPSHVVHHVSIAVVVEDWADAQTLEEMGIEPPDIQPWEYAWATGRMWERTATR